MTATATAGSATWDPLDALGHAIDTDRRWLFGSVIVAACLHVALALALPRPARAPSRPAIPVAIVDVETLPPPPPPVLDEPPAPPAAPTTEAPQSSAPKHETPPSPAQAAKVLARDERDDNPADLTGGFVTGNGAVYAGGTTSSAGTSTRVVHEASAAGTPVRSGSAGTTAAPSNGPDRSRRASLEGGSTWRCPFPAEADNVNEGAVPMRVELDAAGHVLHAAVLSDPGHGFGREAARCVYDKRWLAALDREGSPVAATTVIVVRFVR